MVAHLRRREVGVPGLVVVGIDAAQAGGVRADRAVGEQVAGRAERAELAGAARRHRARPSSRRRPGPARRRRGSSIARKSSSLEMSGPPSSCSAPMPSSAARCRVARWAVRRWSRPDRLAGHPAYDVVGLGADVPAVLEADRGARLGGRGEQRARDDRGVHVDAREVDDSAVRRPVELVPRGRPVLGPGGLVPAVAEDDAAAGSPGERGDSLEALGQAAGVAEVEAGQRDAGRGRVHVGVDERRCHEGAVELDDLVGRRSASASASSSPEPADPRRP